MMAGRYLALLALGTLDGCGTNACPAMPPPPMSVTVFDAVTGTQIDGASVGGARDDGQRLDCSRSAGPKGVVPDFTCSPALPGVCTITVSAPGYETQMQVASQLCPRLSIRHRHGRRLPERLIHDAIALGQRQELVELF